MINKKILSSVIDKYYLKGFCNSVIWEVKDKNLVIKFVTQNKDMIGKLTYEKFPLKDSQLAIYDTDLLNRQLQITSGDIQLNIIENKGLSTKLLLSDSQYNIEFALANTLLIPPVGQIKEPEQYHIEADLDFDTINAIIKAKNALTKINTVVFELEKSFTGGDDLSITFGDVNNYSNKIKYNIQSVQVNGISSLELIFNSDLLKEVLEANKSASEAKMYLFDQGLMKFTFIDDDIKSEYYLVCREV